MIPVLQEGFMAAIDLNEVQEKVILVGVQQQLDDDITQSLEELGELARTAGAQVVGMTIQKRESIHPGTYIGKGKIDEVKTLLMEEEADGIICDDELSPAQMRNLEQELDCKVMDRTMVILDIFAARASTSEGKIQVEMAQLKYRAARLIGMGHVLSRLGGGIGTRGPGEKKLEMDRRLIKTRVAQLNKELEDVVRHREVMRTGRTRQAIPVAAIVGYTNAGKSTLLNLLTNAGVLEEDLLFATLDPTTRQISLESGQKLLLTDTVGFIRKLPHHLINAFRSTLEEAKYADVIIHVVDASNPQMDQQMYVVYETLEKLGVKDKPIITAFNKMDSVAPDIRMTLKDFKADKTVHMSAKTGEGTEALLEEIEEILRHQKRLIEHVFSYNDAGKIADIRKYGQLIEEEYREDGIFVKAYIPESYVSKIL